MSAVLVRKSCLTWKYALSIASLVSILLVAHGTVDIYHSYHVNRQALSKLQSEQVRGAAEQIAQFSDGVAAHIGRTIHPRFEAGEAALSKRRFEFLSVLRNAPAITEFAYLDSDGTEQLRISRVNGDVISGGEDRSDEAVFTQVRAPAPYFSAVYFRNGSEPYASIALESKGSDRGVVVADVNLKFILEVLTRIRFGEAGHAYVVDAGGNLIAHTDVTLVLQKTNLALLPQVEDAVAAPAGTNGEAATVAEGVRGAPVLTSYAAIAEPRWFVFVEQALVEAWAPWYASIWRTALTVLVGVVLAILVSLILSRRLVNPIRLLETGATRIGAGEFDQRVAVDRDDELGRLAGAFNNMAGRLQDSYAELEHKVEERTRELARSVEESAALVEVGKAVSSSLDLNKVLSTIATHAVKLSGADGGYIYEYDSATGFFHQRAKRIEHEALTEVARAASTLGEDSLVARAASSRCPVQIADLAEDESYKGHLRPQLVASGARALLAVPLLRDDCIIGGMAVVRRGPGSFSEQVVALLQAFAMQSVIAIENARLFREIEDKGRELELVNRHKSQFLANMSHELRTPLSAILGFTELIDDEVYGPVPDKIHEVLERVEHDGRHLLKLINSVLDLSKIESGRLKLSLADYSMAEVVSNVTVSLDSLVKRKGLALTTELQRDLPLGCGDVERIHELLLNLVGNAIKFTETGGVIVRVEHCDGAFHVCVSDTGPGVAEADRETIFEEFLQVDGTSTRLHSGTGLGLAIGKRIVALHGGEIGVDSTPGAGSTFWFRLPVRVDPNRVAA